MVSEANSKLSNPYPGDQSEMYSRQIVNNTAGLEVMCQNSKLIQEQNQINRLNLEKWSGAIRIIIRIDVYTLSQVKNQCQWVENLPIKCAM